jgi:hypothetical protein
VVGDGRMDAVAAELEAPYGQQVAARGLHWAHKHSVFQLRAELLQHQCNAKG